MFAVQCSQSVLRAAAAKRSGKNLAVHARAKQAVSKGVFENGTIADDAKAADALQKLVTALGIKSKRVSLCLSPSVVYTTLVRVPKVRSGMLTAAVKGELEALLPEPIDSMDIHFSPVRKDERGMRIAVTAVSKAVLLAYKDLFKSVGLSLANVTTTGLAIGDMIKADTFMLVNAEDSDPSIIVFYGGKPIDELLLSSTAAKSVISDLTDLLKEYSADEMPITDVAVHGTVELVEKVEAALQPKKVAKDTLQQREEVITVQHVLPNLEKTDLEWGGVILSSLGKGLDVRKSSVSNPRQGILAVLFLIATGYFVWTMASTQILGFWSEIVGM